MPRGPFVPIPNTCKVELIGHDIGDNRPVVCVMAAGMASGSTATYAGDIAACFDTFLHDMSPQTNGEVQWDTIRVTDLNSATGVQITVPTTRGGSGGDSPPGLSFVFFLNSASRGRSYNGRHFWPVDGGHVDNATGNYDATQAGNVITHLEALQTALQALTPASELRVVSRKHAVGTQVVSFSFRQPIGRVRRRAFG